MRKYNDVAIHYFSIRNRSFNCVSSNWTLICCSRQYFLDCSIGLFVIYSLFCRAETELTDSTKVMMVTMYDNLLELELPDDSVDQEEKFDLVDIRIWARDEYIKKNIDVIRKQIRKHSLANMLKYK